MVIGIIDSGKGGLAVAKRLKNTEDEFIVLLDQGFFPYGNKSKEFLLKRAYYLVTILIEKKVDLIVLACNTLSIVTLKFLRQSFPFPILGVFEYFVPYLNEDYILIGSKTTINYAAKNYPVSVYDGTDFIEAIEKNKNITPYLKGLENLKCKGLLLGCTHFLFLNEVLFPLPILHQIDDLIEDIEQLRELKKIHSFR